MPPTHMRVCIDDMLGPYDAQVDPTFRWNGWQVPMFTLDTVREIAARTLEMADEYGYDCQDTVHVIEGRVDSRDTVHILDSNLQRDTDDEGEDPEPLGIAVRVNWRDVDQGVEQATTIAVATRAARKAARRRKPSGKGTVLTAVVHIRWQWVNESDTGADVIEPNRDGLYGIGGCEWTWYEADPDTAADAGDRS
ncbi:hypothetical protein [Streptomyces sp. NPDC086782]|uniref:hypothetical protein n=1 Tax=Streptomyces sp. NPDC086782 TaxID=3365757 RepID=UPI0038289006